MTSFNGYSFTNLSSGDTLSNPDVFLNPTNAMDDNDVTTADLTVASTGTEVTKTLGTTFSSATIVVVRVKADIDLNIGSASYASEVKLQGFNGTSWIDLLSLGTSTTQTLNIDTLIRGSFTVEGLRIAFISTVDSGNNIDMDLFTLSYGTSFTYTPKILLDSFKDGTNIEDLGDKTAISEDHTLTWKSMLNLTATGVAQNAYQILQSNNIFENKDNLAVDEFVDADGTKNTVNTGSSTASYNSTTDVYTLFEEATETINMSQNGSLTNPIDLTWTGTTFTKGFISQLSAKIDVGGDWIGNVEIKDSGATTIASKIGITLTNTGEREVNFVQGDYSALLDNETLSIVFTRTSGTGQFITHNGGGTNTGSLIEIVGDAFDGVSDEVVFDQINFLPTGSTVVCDTNIKTLDGTEESICIYADNTTPTNTSISVDISDGTTTLAAQNFNEVIGLTGFSSGTLKLTFNLDTTDTSATPTLKGYGVLIK